MTVNVVPDLTPVANKTLKSCTSPPPGAAIVSAAAVAVLAVNPSEYAAADPEVPPEFAVVISKVFAETLEIVPLKLSALAFLTLTKSPLEWP